MAVSDYILVDKPGIACDFIKSASECKAAAQKLQLSDTRVTLDDNNDDPKHDPPYCYMEDGVLKFNGDGSNYGPCGNAAYGMAKYGDRCLCKKHA